MKFGVVVAAAYVLNARPSDSISGFRVQGCFTVGFNVFRNLV